MIVDNLCFVNYVQYTYGVTFHYEIQQCLKALLPVEKVGIWTFDTSDEAT